MKASTLGFLRVALKGQLYLFGAITLLFPLVLLNIRLGAVLQGLLFVVLLLWQLGTGWVLLLWHGHRSWVRWAYMMLILAYFGVLFALPAARPYAPLLRVGVMVLAVLYYYQCKRDAKLVTLWLLTQQKPPTHPYDFSRPQS